MASKIVAINTFRPRIECGNTVQKQELVRQLARATGLNEGAIDLIIADLRVGRGVKVEGLESV